MANSRTTNLYPVPTSGATDQTLTVDSTAGGVTTTAPTGSGKAVTRLGEAATATDFSIQSEPPVLLV